MGFFIEPLSLQVVTAPKRSIGSVKQGGKKRNRSGVWGMG